MKEIGGWREDMLSSQEQDLFFRLVTSGAVSIRDSRPLSVIRKRVGSISSSDISGNIVRLIYSLLEIREYLEEYDEVEYQELINQLLFGKLRELANYELSLATKLFSKIIDPNFRPQISSVNSRVFVSIFKLVGFHKAHLVRSLFRSV